jgi:V/A-type H+-transporting ATPase subunit K
MSWLIALMGFPWRPPSRRGSGWNEAAPFACRREWLKGGCSPIPGVRWAGMAGAMLLGVQEVMAAEPVPLPPAEISLGKGLALIGIGLPTASGRHRRRHRPGTGRFRRPGRDRRKAGDVRPHADLHGLAEGIAIYGLVMSILLLGKI